MITIYEKNEKRFDTLGLGTLVPISCSVEQELNGMFELEMVHPYDMGGKWKRIEDERIIYASTPKGYQPFVIYETERRMDCIKVKAEHMFFRLRHCIFRKRIYKGPCNEVVSSMSANGFFPSGFLWNTDYLYTLDTPITIGANQDVNILQVLFSDDPDIFSWTKALPLEIYQNYISYPWIQGVDVIFKQPQTKPIGTTIRYGKNLKGLNVKENIADVVTVIKCIGSNGEKEVKSPYFDKYAYPRMTVLEDQKKPLSELVEQAEKMFLNGADLPIISVDVDFIPLSKIAEYEKFAFLENIYLGDIVTVINERMDYAAHAKAIYYKWNCLTERYTGLKLGEFMPSIGGSVTTGVNIGAVAANAGNSAAAAVNLIQEHLQDFKNPHRVQEILTGIEPPKPQQGKEKDLYIKTPDGAPAVVYIKKGGAWEIVLNGA